MKKGTSQVTPTRQNGENRPDSIVPSLVPYGSAVPVPRTHREPRTRMWIRGKRLGSGTVWVRPLRPWTVSHLRCRRPGDDKESWI